MMVELDCSLGLRFAHATWDPCLDEFGGYCGDFGEGVVMKIDGDEMVSSTDHLDEVGLESHHFWGYDNCLPFFSIRVLPRSLLLLRVWILSCWRKTWWIG